MKTSLRFASIITIALALAGCYTPPPQPVAKVPEPAQMQPEPDPEPVPEVVFGEPMAEPQPAAAAAPEPVPTTALPPEPVQVARSYTVKKGDTLWSIAQREYGNGHQWKQIADANPGVDPKKLVVGQKLVLP